MGLGRMLGTRISQRAAPQVSARWVRAVLGRAIDGIGPLKPVTEVSARRLAAAGGDADHAIAGAVTRHVVLAASQAFVTNLGGLATAAVSLPANAAGLAVLQFHLVAQVAELRGYDVSEPQVRNALQVCLLGPDGTRSLIRRRRLPSGPGRIAASPHDADLDDVVSRAVAAAVIANVTGRRAATMIGRRIPFLGGVVAAASDAWSTRQIASFARSEFTQTTRTSTIPRP